MRPEGYMRVSKTKKGRMHLIAGDDDYTLCGLRLSRFSEQSSELDVTDSLEMTVLSTTHLLCKHCERIRDQEQ